MHVTAIVKHFVPKTRIQQMQYSMFGASNIEINRHPFFLKFWIDENFVIVRINKTKEVPTRACPLRHGIGFSFVFDSIDNRIKPLVIGFFKRWIGPTMRLVIFDLGQIDGQLIKWNRPNPSRFFAVLVFRISPTSGWLAFTTKLYMSGILPIPNMPPSVCCISFILRMNSGSVMIKGAASLSNASI